jgi:hypothetical protein
MGRLRQSGPHTLAVDELRAEAPSIPNPMKYATLLGLAILMASSPVVAKTYSSCLRDIRDMDIPLAEAKRICDPKKYVTKPNEWGWICGHGDGQSIRVKGEGTRLKRDRAPTLRLAARWLERPPVNSRIRPPGSRIENEARRKAITSWRSLSLLTDVNPVAVREVLPCRIAHPGNPQHREDQPEPKQSARNSQSHAETLRAEPAFA